MAFNFLVISKTKGAKLSWLVLCLNLLAACLHSSLLPCNAEQGSARGEAQSSAARLRNVALVLKKSCLERVKWEQ